MSRAVTEKVTNVFGSLFSKTEMSEVMTEICKMDPNFDPIPFAKQCREDIIPNILEAIIQGRFFSLGLTVWVSRPLMCVC